MLIYIIKNGRKYNKTLIAQPIIQKEEGFEDWGK